MVGRYLTIIAFFAAYAMCTASIAAQSEVTTIAGSGAAGIADGPAEKATFLFPSGVAVSHDGSIYIADRAAQRIRVLASGQVRTVAGSGPIAPPGLSVAGGYLDGPALQARFSGPEGLAVAPDGALFIADSFNHCVRKLKAGEVSTVVGKCTDAGATDGSVDRARLEDPEALTFDAAGNLYIADNGVGLRRFGTDGTLVTIHLRSYAGQSALGVALIQGSQSLVAEATLDGIALYNPSTATDQFFSVYPLWSPWGAPNQLAVLDARQMVFSNVIAYNIGYFRLPEVPLLGQPYAGAIAGGASEQPFQNAGYVNGSLSDARFYDPMGIAVLGNTIVLADGGNRRIRQIVLPGVRVPETVTDLNPTDANHYHVALVGGPWSFVDTTGADSICAHMEAVLDRSRRFLKPVRCHAVPIASGSEADMEEYVKTVLPHRHMDLAILALEPDAVADIAAFRARVSDLLDMLTPLHTRLALIWVYPSRDVSFADTDWLLHGDASISSPAPPALSYERTRQIESEVRGTPVLQYDSYTDLVNFELSSNAIPLFTPPGETGPNPRGNAFLGEHFAQGLLDAGLGRP